MESLLLQEKTRAAAAPRNPKKGAVSSPLKPEAISSPMRSDRKETKLFDDLRAREGERQNLLCLTMIF